MPTPLPDDLPDDDWFEDYPWCLVQGMFDEHAAKCRECDYTTECLQIQAQRERENGEHE